MSGNLDTPSEEVQRQPGPALQGVRIVDFSRVLAGPFATQLLGDLGADIIKVEQVGKGDDTRVLLTEPQHGGESFFYLALNRNKRSIALDLNTESGRQVALELIATADVVIENFTTRVMKNFGLDYDSLKDRFPKLVYCSISAFGRTGPLANAAGFDAAMAMLGGVAALNAAEGERPSAGGVPFIDITTALTATIGILAALNARRLYGKGQFVESALYDNAIASLSYKGVQYLMSGVSPVSAGRKPKFGVPGGDFDCRDGIIWFTCSGQKMYKALCEEVVERPDLLHDDRFSTPENRTRYSDVLYDTFAEIFSTRPRSYWSDRMVRAGIPVGELRSVGEALSSEETAQREMIAQIPHGIGGNIPIIKTPIRLSLTPPDASSPPPLLGQDSIEILRELAYDDRRIADLVAEGAVQDLICQEMRTKHQDRRLFKEDNIRRC